RRSLEPDQMRQSDTTSASFKVKVHPRAKKDALTGMVGDAYKLSLTVPPVDGRANAACIEFFAKLFAVPRSSITIAAGATGRTKVIRVSGISTEEADRLLIYGAANK